MSVVCDVKCGSSCGRGEKVENPALDTEKMKEPSLTWEVPIPGPKVLSLCTYMYLSNVKVRPFITD